MVTLLMLQIYKYVYYIILCFTAYLWEGVLWTTSNFCCVRCFISHIFQVKYLCCQYFLSSIYRKECYTAFLSLRRYANLILNLFSLMVDASVPDIALEPDKTVRKVQVWYRVWTLNFSLPFLFPNHHTLRQWSVMKSRNFSV